MPRPTGLARIVADAAIKLQQYAATGYERQVIGDARRPDYGGTGNCLPCRWSSPLVVADQKCLGLLCSAPDAGDWLNIWLTSADRCRFSTGSVLYRILRKYSTLLQRRP